MNRLEVGEELSTQFKDRLAQVAIGNYKRS